METVGEIEVFSGVGEGVVEGTGIASLVKLAP